MNNKTPRRAEALRRLALIAALILLTAPQARAAEPVPGSSCAGQHANSFIWSGGPENGGVTNGMFCNGGTNLYTGILNFQSTGYVGIGTTSPGALLDVGLAGTTLGTMRLEGNTSGYVQIQPSAAAGSWTATLPNTAGTSGYVLSTDGAGNLSWISNAGTASTALSGITAAAAGHTIANANNAQVWNWATMTTGTALSLNITNATNSTGTTLNVTNAENAGVNYGIYASDASASGFGIYGTNSASAGIGIEGEADNGVAVGVKGLTTSTTDSAIGVIGKASGATGATTGVYGQTNSSTNGANGVYGFTNAATGVTRGVYGSTNSATAGSSGVYGYAQAGATYGVFGTSSSATGFGGYFTNTNGGYALATGSGNVGIGTASPGAELDVNGAIRLNDLAQNCSHATDTGAIRYNSVTFKVQSCKNGTGWTDIGTGVITAPAGSDEQVQLNNNGVLYASSGLKFNSTTGDLIVPNGQFIVTKLSVSKAFYNTSAVPTISSCGTSPPAATTGSSNNWGQFTLGTGSPTACTVTFANAFPSNAYCVVTPATSYTGTYYISAQSKSAFTVTLGTGTSSAKFNYACGGN